MPAPSTGLNLRTRLDFRDCVKCGQRLPIARFRKRSKRFDHRMKACMDCHAASERLRRAAIRDREDRELLFAALRALGSHDEAFRESIGEQMKRRWGKAEVWADALRDRIDRLGEADKAKALQLLAAAISQRPPTD